MSERPSHLPSGETFRRWDPAELGGVGDSHFPCSMFREKCPPVSPDPNPAVGRGQNLTWKKNSRTVGRCLGLRRSLSETAVLRFSLPAWMPHSLRWILQNVAEPSSYRKRHGTSALRFQSKSAKPYFQHTKVWCSIYRWIIIQTQIKTTMWFLVFHSVWKTRSAGLFELDYRIEFQAQIYR